MPMDMQPSSGETSAIAQMPQNANSVAIETISRLSVERLRKNSLSITPNSAPSASTQIFARIGAITVESCMLPLCEAIATEIATLYRIRPTTSSSATTCRSVSTKSPCAPVCRIVIMVEAGAVAEASAESTMEKLNSRCSTP